MLAAVPAHADSGDLTAYVRARAAAADGAVDIAAAGYAAALAASPDDQVVAIRAYREGLAAGDYALAMRAARVLFQAKAAPADAAILVFSAGLQVRNQPVAEGALQGMAAGPLEFAVPVLRAWLALDHGQDPIPLLEAGSKNALARRYGAEHRALLLLAGDHFDEGMAALRPLLGADRDDVDLRIDAAMLLAGRGKRKLALPLLEGDAPELAAARRDLRGAKATPAFGASRLFTRIAADLSDEELQPLSIVLTRSALLLDPADDRARILLAQALARSGAIREALATLDQVRRDGAYGRDAALASIAVLGGSGKNEAALDRARALAEAKDATGEDFRIYGDVLSANAQYEAAARAYAEAMRRLGGDRDWALQLQYGGALERAGHWDAALPVLRHAAEIAPDQPAVLNYLGYAQVERGENLTEAQHLLERASRLQPDSAAITDSLGWAYFQRGDVARALPLLERAARAEPADTTINEHLGDAYWRVGRRYEARYAWRAAATLAEGAEARRIEAKLATGLAPARQN